MLFRSRYRQVTAEIRDQQNKNTAQALNPGAAVLNMTSLNRLREMTAGSDPNFFSQVIKMFLDQGHEIISTMEEKCRRKEWQEMSSLAHKLKGSSLNLGASLLAETCRQIELSGKSENPSACEKLTPVVRSHWDQTVQALEAVLKTEKNS